MPTIIPNAGSDYERRIAATRGQILADEIHTTRDQNRVFKGNYLVAPVSHQGVTSEADMLLLNTTSARGCFAFDIAIRTDTDSAWLCIAGRGTTIEQWFELAGLGSADLDTLFGGLFSMGDLADTFEGGDFSGFSADTILGGFFHDGIHGGYF